MLCSQTQDQTQVRRGLWRRIEWRTEVLWRACGKLRYSRSQRSVGAWTMYHTARAYTYTSLTKLRNRLLEGTLDQPYRRPAEQPDGLSYGFATVAISANPPHFMSWTLALTAASVGVCACRRLRLSASVGLCLVTATLTCYLQLVQYSYYFLHLL